MPTHEMSVQLHYFDLWQSGTTGTTANAEKCSRSEDFAWRMLS